MSKRKKNYPDPGLIVQNYGADALRSELSLGVCQNMNACAPTAGFSVCGHPTLLAGTVSKETNPPSHALIVRTAPH